jgi:hypothetical protein
VLVRLLVPAVTAGVLLDAARGHGAATLAMGLLVPVLAAAIVLVPGRRARDCRVLAALAVVLAGFVAVRAAPWLVAADLATAAGLLAGAALLANRGRVLDLDLSVLVVLTRRALPAAARAVAGRVGGIAGRVPAQIVAEERAPVLRGVVLAVPLSGVLLLLLASSDAVFAHLFELPVPGAAVPVHGLTLAAGAAVAGALAAVAMHAPAAAIPRRRRRRRRSEAEVVLAAADLVLAAFAATQAVAMLGGADAVLRSQGLTYAEYARTGFFQLVAVAVVMLAVVGGVRAVVQPTRLVAFLGAAAVALTLVVVAVAAHRMRLYQQAYGLTVQRLVVEWSIAGIALALVVIGVALVRNRSARHWLPAALAAIAVAGLIGLNLSNPEARIARVNIDRARGGVPLDLAYLAGLSADAAPVLAADPHTRALVVGRFERPRGLLGWNLALARAPQ